MKQEKKFSSQKGKKLWKKIPKKARKIRTIFKYNNHDKKGSCHSLQFIIIISCSASAEPILGQCYLILWGLGWSNEDPMGILSGYAPLIGILHHRGIQGWWWTPTCGSCLWSFLLLPLLYSRLPSPSLGGLFCWAGFLLCLGEPHLFATAHLLATFQAYIKLPDFSLAPPLLQNFSEILVVALPPGGNGVVSRVVDLVVLFCSWYGFASDIRWGYTGHCTMMVGELISECQ